MLTTMLDATCDLADSALHDEIVHAHDLARCCYDRSELSIRLARCGEAATTAPRLWTSLHQVLVAT